MAELGNVSGGRASEVQIDTRLDSDRRAIVTVSGEIDVTNAARLEAAVSSAAAGSPDQLIFDLGGLRFMDSAGVAVLVGATRKVGVVKLRSPSQIVRRVVELTGLSSVLPIEE